MSCREESMRWRCAVAIGIAFVISGAGASQAVDVITGKVRNLSRSQPASGDAVVLLRIDGGGLKEETRSFTDPTGAFSFPTHDRAKSYLVRVEHQGVHYEARASVADPISIDVFDASPVVDGLVGTVEIIRAGTAGNHLHVSDMIEIQNRSSPPLTLSGERTFQIDLPSHAHITSVLAAGPGNIATMITAREVAGQPGAYVVSFPLQPGATKFAFNYNLPYNDHAAVRVRHTYPAQQVAVMIPAAMKFSSSSSAFHVLQTGNPKYQVRALSQLKAESVPEFEISGSGPLPPVAGRENAEAHSAMLVPANPPLPKAAAVVRPSTKPTALPASRQINSAAPARRGSAEPWTLGVLGLILAAAGAAGIWRAYATKRGRMRTRTTEIARLTPLEDVKEELFQLESARIRGSISSEQYASRREGLEETVRRAVRRAS